MNSGVKWILRGLATCVLGLIGIGIWALIQFGFMAEERYVLQNPDREATQLLEKELGVSFPDDLHIGKMTSPAFYFDEDTWMDIDVYSNYSEEQWKKLLEGSTQDYSGKFDFYSYREYRYSKANLLSSDKKYRLKILVRERCTELDDFVKKNGSSNIWLLNLMSGLIAILFGMIALLPVFPFSQIRDAIAKRKCKS